MWGAPRRGGEELAAGLDVCRRAVLSKGAFTRSPVGGDGDGERELHCNTLEGIWTGLRNFLRPFRGVNKVYLYQSAVIFEWGLNIKRVTGEFIRALAGLAARGREGSPLTYPS